MKSRVGRPRTLADAISADGAEKQLSRPWLASAAIVGTVLIAFHLLWESNTPHPWSSLALEAGASILLFVLLLLFERMLVERTVTSTVRRLTALELEEQRETEGLNPLTPGDFRDSIGPLAVAGAFIRDVAVGNFRDAFLLGDPTWRLCRAQAWLHNNRETLKLDEIADDERDELARHLANGPHDGEPVWEAFNRTESDQFRRAFERYDDDTWGWSQRRRIVGSHHEVVIATPLPRDAPHGFVAQGPTILGEAIHVLLACHVVDGKRIYNVAGIDATAPPAPGWPPSWWIIDDPVAAEAHPGVDVAETEHESDDELSQDD